MLKVGGEAAEALSGAGMLTAKEGGEIAENSLRAGVDDVARGVEGAEGAAVAAKEEITVYRVFGGDARAQGFSWTTENPATVKDFRNLAGLPSGGASGATNTADFVLSGQVKASDILETRSALPLDGNAGGLLELIIDPKNVKLTDFSVFKP